MIWTVKIERDDLEGGIVPLPYSLLAELGMGIGDSLHLSQRQDADGARYLILRKKLMLDRTHTLDERLTSHCEVGFHSGADLHHEMPRLPIRNDFALRNDIPAETPDNPDNS